MTDLFLSRVTYNTHKDAATEQRNLPRRAEAQTETPHAVSNTTTTITITTTNTPAVQPRCSSVGIPFAGAGNFLLVESSLLGISYLFAHTTTVDDAILVMFIVVNAGTREDEGVLRASQRSKGAGTTSSSSSSSRRRSPTVLRIALVY